MKATDTGLKLLSLSLAVAASGEQQQKIENVVVVMMENRAYDHILGWSSSLNANGLTGTECNYLNLTERVEELCVSDDAININLCDPSHIVDATTFKIFGGSYDDSNSSRVGMDGFAAYEADKEGAVENNYCSVMSGFKASDLPVLNTLAAEYAVFDRFFASVPGPTWPNRLMALTATALGADGDIWYQSVPGQFYPQKSIYEQIDESGLTWKNYYNDTPWELMLQYVTDHPDNLQPMDSFFYDCQEGTLPSFSWINPRTGINVTTGIGSNDFHPTHDAYAAEEFYKDIYEAIRASPQWNNTLMIITFDEHGGFYDHVDTPSVGVPAPEDPISDWTDDTAYFDFKRLGVRIPTIAISPWIPAGTVVSDAPTSNKPSNTSEFDLTSIMATVRKLFPGMDQSPLTNRDAWSSTFEYIFDTLSEPRGDCPIHLPDSMVPTPAYTNDTDAGVTAAFLASIAGHKNAPLIDIQEDIARVHAHLAGVHVPVFTDQSAHAEQVADHFKAHHTRTRCYLAHKAAAAAEEGSSSSSSIFSVEMLVKNNPAGSGEAEGQWDINGIAHGGNPMYADASGTTPYHTVSTRNLTSVSQSGDVVYLDPYCLDGGSGEVGNIITISPCLPSQDPVFNRADGQHFYYSTEGYLKFYNSSSPMDDWLCVTNRNPDGQSSVASSLYLSPCDHSAQQQWAYNGYAPGNGGDGVFSYGVHFIGVMETVGEDNDEDSGSGSASSTSDLFSGDNLIIWTSAGGVLCVALVVLLGAFIFLRRKHRQEIIYVYKDGDSKAGSGAPATAVGIGSGSLLSRSSSVNANSRPSSMNNQQGSTGSRHESSTEMSHSLTKGLERSEGDNQA